MCVNSVSTVMSKQVKIYPMFNLHITGWSPHSCKNRCVRVVAPTQHLARCCNACVAGICC
jgi:hypothetical protein